MSSTAAKQRTGKSKSSTPLEYPRTRAFLKKHGLVVPDLFQPDGGTSEGRVQTQKYLKAPDRSRAKDNTVGGASKKSKESKDQGSESSIIGAAATTRTSAEATKLARLRHSAERAANFEDDPNTETPISAWLHRVTIDHSDEQGIVDSSPAAPTTSIEWEVGSMASSSSINTSESTTTSNITSAKASTVKKVKIPYKELLEFRGITNEPSEDSKFDRTSLEKIGEDAVVHFDEESIHSILSILQKNLTQGRKIIKEGVFDTAFEFFEALRQDIEDWIPKTDVHRRFPSTSLRHFTIDREHCLTSSEADFQRTLMISMIDRFDFQDFFSYSCEEQWTMEPDYHLPSLGSPNKIAQPKPDLAISFQRNGLRGPALLPYPINLSRCLHPGNTGDNRWFPFFFMEAKRADHTLEHAQERNLHNASQALFNIYQWMKTDDDLRAKFFDSVRVFTISLNVRTIRLRMHRAETIGQDGRLFYHFQEVIDINDYDRTKACHIMKTILLDYAKPHLLPILKEAFQRVAQRELNYGKRKKRKQNESNRNTSEIAAAEIDDEERAAGTEPTSSQGPGTTGLSFATEDIQLSRQSRKRGKVGTRSGR